LRLLNRVLGIICDERLERAEGQRVHDDVNLAIGPQHLGQPIQDFGALFGVRRVGVDEVCLDAQRLDLRDDGFGCCQRSPQIQVNAGDVHAGGGQGAACGGAEPARCAQNQGPFALEWFLSHGSPFGD